MALRIFLKGGFEFNVFSIGAALCDQGRSLFLGEFKRETDTGLQESVVTMRNVVGAKWPVRLTEPRKLRRRDQFLFP